MFRTAAMVAAIPSFMDDPIALEQAKSILRRNDALGLSKSESNCGLVPCTTFDEDDQLITLTGPHSFESPGLGDIRGPCPGLNAAANHGFLPRNG